MIEDKPNYWGTPLSDWKDQNLDPMTQELAKTLVARSCKVPNCGYPASWDGYCDRHLVEINEAYEHWQEWKVTKALDTMFIPYEELKSE